jgi:hypothetical protein
MRASSPIRLYTPTRNRQEKPYTPRSCTLAVAEVVVVKRPVYVSYEINFSRGSCPHFLTFPGVVRIQPTNGALFVGGRCDDPVTYRRLSSFDGPLVDDDDRDDLGVDPADEPVPEAEVGGEVGGGALPANRSL